MVATGIDSLTRGSAFWWSGPDDERSQRIVQLVERIIQEQDYIKTANLDHLRSYSKRDYYEDGDGNIVPQGPSAYIGINATRSAIDTIVAKVTQQDPRPHFVTDGGNWNQRNRARKLQKFIDGVFYMSDFYRKARAAFKDAAIFGTGFLKPYYEAGKIKFDRVFPGNVVVDEASAINGHTKSMFHWDNIPIETLAAKFPKKESELLASNLSYKTTRDGLVTNLIRVYEAWHLPDANGRGGRHTICTNGIVLVDEDYTEEFEPLIKFTWTDSLAGYYGHGAVEDVAPLQEELDYMMGRTQIGVHNAANVWLLKPISCEVPNSHLTNQMVSIIEYAGEPPQFYHSQAVHQQVVDLMKWFNELIYNVTGVSAMSATSQKPKGIESGKALQTMLDVESQRFAEVQKNYENFIIRCTQACLGIARSNFSGGKSEYSVRVSNGRFTETIKWKEVNMNEDEYVLKVWPTNMLPQSPSGKMEWVERMMQAGLIDALTGMMLLDFPDVEAQQSLLFSAVRQALWIVDQVIYEGKEVAPREWYDLQRCIMYMQMGLANAEMEGAPQEVLDRGMDFIASCQELLTPPAPPPMDAMGLGGQPPAAPPMGPEAGGMPQDMAPPMGPQGPTVMPPPGYQPGM